MSRYVLVTKVCCFNQITYLNHLYLTSFGETWDERLRM